MIKERTKSQSQDRSRNKVFFIFLTHRNDMSPLSPLASTAAPTSDENGNKIILVSHVLPYTCTLTRSPSTNTTSPTHVRSPSSSGIRFTGIRRVGSSLSDYNLHDNATSRLPWRFARRRDHTALYAGLLSLQERRQCLFIGGLDYLYDAEGLPIDGTSVDAAALQSLESALRQKLNCVPVWVDNALRAGHYEGYCKSGTI
jgi:hypothetical protein